MLRVGVDIMDVERIARGVERYGDKFYNRVFTEKERCLCEGNPQRLAARFAAKEATAKALGTGIGAVRWTEIEVDCDSRGRPFLRLHGNAARLAAELNLTTWDISLSHTTTQAVAFVVAMAG